MRLNRVNEFWMVLAAAALLGSACGSASACGLDWSEPKSHFEGVSNYGQVFLVETLGEIGIRDGKKLPVRAIFRSESNATSPYVGHGWELPLLESHIVQLDEKWFRVLEPTGWYRLFWRDDKDPTILHGQSGWKGVVRGNSISVMAECGDRLDFVEGKIHGIEIKGHKLEVERTADGRATLKDGTTALLTVARDPLKEEATLQMGSNQAVKLGYADRPLVEVIGGQALVSQQVKSLGQIIRGEGGGTRAVEYAVDEKLQPTITLGDRVITWNPTSKLITKDGEWTYDVKAGEGLYAAIGRTNAKKQREFWHRDEPNGQEIVQGIDGVKKVTSWFTSGKLAGKTRNKEEIVKGKTRVIYQASFDERGNLFRELLENGEINQFAYSEDGSPKTKTRLAQNGEPKDMVEYADGGKMRIVRSASGRTTEYHYDGQGRESKMIVNGNLHSETFYGPNRSWEKVVVYNQKTGEPTRTFFKELDDRGRALTERITEHSEEYPEIYRQFFYDPAGQLAKKLDSQQGTVEYLDGPDGGRIARILQ